MKSSTLKCIYDAITEKQEQIVSQRREARSIHKTFAPYQVRGREGIMVMKDPLALLYQKCERVKSHVGCHLFAQRDRERGMKSALCAYAREEYKRLK